MLFLTPPPHSIHQKILLTLHVDFIHFFPSLILPPSPPLSLSLTNAIASQYWSSLPLFHISYKLVIIHQPEYSSNTTQIMWLARNSSVIYVFCSYNKIHIFFPEPLSTWPCVIWCLFTSPTSSWPLSPLGSSHTVPFSVSWQGPNLSCFWKALPASFALLASFFFSLAKI